MKTKVKKVYYCEHCSKHGLTAGAIGKHEKYCTANPDRECRMCEINSEVNDLESNDLKALIEKYKTIAVNQSKIGEFGEYVNGEDVITTNTLMGDTNGCPACALAIIRQAEIFTEFRYKDEIRKFWKVVRENEQKEEERYAQYDIY